MSGPMSTGQLLDVQGVSRSFWTGGLLSRRRVDAVRDVSFMLAADKPEIFDIIGEFWKRQNDARSHDPQHHISDTATSVFAARSCTMQEQARPDALHGAGPTDLPEPVRASTR